MKIELPIVRVPKMRHARFLKDWHITARRQVGGGTRKFLTGLHGKSLSRCVLGWQLLSIADPRILSWWTETDLRTDSLHQSDAPLGLTWCSWLLTCAHAAWKLTSASLLFCTSGEETIEKLKNSRGQLAPCQKKRIKQQQTVSSARCKLCGYRFSISSWNSL